MLVLIRRGKIGTKRHQGYMPKERPCADTAGGWPSARLDTGLWRVQSCHRCDLELLAYRQTREKISSCRMSEAICGAPFCGQGDAGVGGPLPAGSFPPRERCAPKPPESCWAARLLPSLTGKGPTGWPLPMHSLSKTRGWGHQAQDLETHGTVMPSLQLFSPLSRPFPPGQA